MKFTELLRARGEGKESPKPPWHLHDKLKCYDFCKAVGLPTVNVLRRFDNPQDINLDGLPTEFVVKPNYSSSSIGVMVLTRTEDGYFDAMNRKTVNLEQIKARHQEIFDKSTKNGLKLTIIEEKVQDTADIAIPYDYKAYAFQGEIAFIDQFDRSGKRTAMSWFDGSFDPLPDGRIMTNEKYMDVRPAVKPEGWEALLNLAWRASVATPAPFARIDMYSTPTGPVIGEITLVPGGFYFGKFFQPSEEQDLAAGAMWGRALTRLGS